MNGNRLKTNLLPHNIEDRLQYRPEIIEFHLNEEDLKTPEKIRQAVRYVKSRGVKVYLHQPPKHGGKYQDILSRDPFMRQFYVDSAKRLAEICREEEIRSVIHAHYSRSESSAMSGLESTLRLREAILEIQAFADNCFCWEDTIEGLFSYANPYLIEHLIEPLRLPLTIDISHTFIALAGDNDGLAEVLKRCSPYAQYFHLVDSFGRYHDSLPLGQGKIDWKRVIPYVKDKDYIYEITLEGDHSDCTPMVKSAEFFNALCEDS